MRQRRWFLVALLLVVTGMVLLLQAFKILGGVVGLAEYLVVAAIILVLFGVALLRRPD